MLTSARTDTGWVEADALVALLIIVIAASAIAGSAYAASGAAARLKSLAGRTVERGNESAERLLEAKPR